MSPVPNKGRRVHPPMVKVPAHMPPSSNKMELSLSDLGTVPGSDLPRGRFRHHPTGLEDPPGMAVLGQGVTATRARPGAPWTPAQVAPPCHPGPLGSAQNDVTRDSVPGEGQGLVPRS